MGSGVACGVPLTKLSTAHECPPRLSLLASLASSKHYRVMICRGRTRQGAGAIPSSRCRDALMPMLQPSHSYETPIGQTVRWSARLTTQRSSRYQPHEKPPLALVVKAGVALLLVEGGGGGGRVDAVDTASGLALGSGPDCEGTRWRDSWIG